MADKITNFEDYKKKGNVEETTEIDIQIEDPYNFFNEQEREEYFQERQKELEREKEAVQEKEEPVPEPDYSDDDYDEEDEDVEEDEDEEEESEGGFPIELLIRISSIITGILILAILAIAFKVKVYDRYLAPDPDQAQTVQLALPTGYTEKNDTVVVTAEKLNLRTVDNSQSDATIVTSVPKGTELSRIAVNEDGTWALVDYNGSRVYASMKYLSEK